MMFLSAGDPEISPQFVDVTSTTVAVLLSCCWPIKKEDAVGYDTCYQVYTRYVVVACLLAWLLRVFCF